MSTSDLSSLVRKFEITSDTVFTVRHAPPDFAATMGDIGDAIWQHSLLAPLDVVITFHRLQQTLAPELPRVTESLAPDGRVWIAWPRSTGELNETFVKRTLDRAGFNNDKACNIDDEWTALRFVRRPVTLRPKDAAKRKR